MNYFYLISMGTSIFPPLKKLFSIFGSHPSYVYSDRDGTVAGRKVHPNAVPFCVIRRVSSHITKLAGDINAIPLNLFTCQSQYSFLKKYLYNYRQHRSQLMGVFSQ